MSALRGTTIAGAAVVAGCCGALVVGVAIVGGTEDRHGAQLDGGGALNDKKVPDKYEKWVLKSGEQCAEVSAPLIAAQIEAESAWDPDAQSRDPQTGAVIAQGLSQFIPGTWDTWGVDAASKDGGGPDGKADPFTPGDAIMTQGRYDCWLAKKVKSYKLQGDQTRLMLAAYNAGPDRVRQYGGIPPFLETQNYVAKIMQLKAEYTKAMSDGGPASRFGERVVANARKWIGTPYSWGGGNVEGPSTGIAQGAHTEGFDCSSLVQYAVYHASDGKLTLPRTSQIQATQGKAVKRSDLRAGDVIAFQLHGPAAGYDHIGIYIGGGQVIHAPKTNETVKIAPLSDWSGKPQTIRRFG